jgi:hypothetical protein
MRRQVSIAGMREAKAEIRWPKSESRPASRKLFRFELPPSVPPAGGVVRAARQPTRRRRSRKPRKAAPRGYATRFTIRLQPRKRGTPNKNFSHCFVFVALQSVKVTHSREDFSRQRPPDFVAQVSKPAVSPTSQSAGQAAVTQAAGWETRDTADLSVSASLRRDRAGAKGEGGEVCATLDAATPRCDLCG